MTREQLRNIEIPGEVVDIKDPYKKGRVRVKVTGIYDGLDIDTIPWASPLKEPNGKSFLRPSKGQVVNVRFEDGDWYRPYYSYAEHYNLNLQKKLEGLSDKEYEEFNSLYLDDKLQIFKDDKKLMIDYAFNQLILDDNTMNLALKDNFGKIKLGTESADQQAVLGNNYFDWMDTLINVMFKPYLGNSGAPVVPDPSLIQVLTQYYALRNTMFLSDNVDIVNNGFVTPVNRPADGQTGDKWKSTVEENEVTVNYYVPPPRPVQPDAEPEGRTTTDENLGESPANNIEQDPGEPIGDTAPIEIAAILKHMQNNNMVIYQDPYKMNIVGVRNHYPGQNYSNKFIDKIYLIYKETRDGDWKYQSHPISTMPGVYFTVKEKHFTDGNGNVKYPALAKYNNKKITMKKYCSIIRKKGVGILMEGQYVNLYEIGKHCGAKAMKNRAGEDGNQYAYRDQDWDNELSITYSSSKDKGWHAMYIHKGYSGTGVGKTVGNWSEGCQVFNSEKDLNSFFDKCEIHKGKYGNVFTYTLMTGRDVEAAKKEVEAERSV